MEILTADALLLLLQELSKKITEAEDAGDFAKSNCMHAEFIRTERMYSAYHLARHTELLEEVTTLYRKYK